jgi:hypothetical protein
VPVTVYAGYDWEAISRLADEDNENDEYHVPVPLPDAWGEYRRLSEQEGWSQEKIADAKRVDQATVSRRLRFASFPPKIQHTFMKHDFLKEVHAGELLKLCNFHHLEPWLDQGLVLCEIVETVLEKHRGGSAEKALPAGAGTRDHHGVWHAGMGQDFPTMK